MERKQGFTLIELLVVISIIAVLLAILMPALQRVKQQATAVACQACLREWGLVMKLYADDNDGYFVHGGSGHRWFTTLQSTYSNRELIYCPAAVKAALPAGNEPGGSSSWFGSTYLSWSYSGHRGSYGLSCWILNRTEGNAWDQPDEWRWRTPYVKRANIVPVMGDCTWGGTHPKQYDNPPPFEGDQTAGYMGRFCIDRHNGGIYMLFCDFSARKVGLKELWQLKWHRNYDENADPPLWPNWMKSLRDY